MFLNIATLAWAGLFVLQVSPAIKLVGKLLSFFFPFFFFFLLLNENENEKFVFM